MAKKLSAANTTTGAADPRDITATDTIVDLIEKRGLDVSVLNSITGDFSTSGLKNGGRITEVALNPTTWVPLPGTALADRNAISIQNETGEKIKINHTTSEPGFIGMSIVDGAERSYDIKDTIPLYGKSETSNVTITIEELS